ncbi:MAG: alpha/beta fold hydrolase [Patescibacteria group bacterium]|nr:alpha/beta fold hydrolase [Patescibacteria group bacterium]
MKPALILHGTNAAPDHNWYPWLARKLEEQSYTVWVPQLPECEYPDTANYNSFLLNPAHHHEGFVFDNQTILIGHSSGSLAVLQLLQALPPEITVADVFLVGAFKDNLGWRDRKGRAILDGILTPDLDFPRLKNRAKRYVLIHSENDPYCPLSHASYLAVRLGGELIIQTGQYHFSVNTAGEKYRKFPFLLDLILRKPHPGVV